MIVNRRKLVFSLVILLLAVLNVWRWWPVSASSSAFVDISTGEFAAEEFVVKAIPVESLPAVSRDIFYPKPMPVQKHQATTPQVAVPIVTAQPLPEKTVEEIARERAQAEFSQIQCVGISVRNERKQAYLISAGEPLLVSSGGVVGSRFVVEDILLDGVSIRDPNTGIGGLIAISGKK